MPQPNVDSAVLRLTARSKPPVYVEDEAFFFSLVQAAFKQRRKTLLNNLHAFAENRMTKEKLAGLLTEIGIDPKRRAESVTMEEFAVMASWLLHSKREE